MIINLYKQNLGESKIFPSASSHFGGTPFLQRPDYEIWWHNVHGRPAGLNAEPGNLKIGSTQPQRGGLLLNRGCSSETLSFAVSVRQKTDWEALLALSVLQLNIWERALKHLQWGNKKLKGRAKEWLIFTVHVSVTKGHYTAKDVFPREWSLVPGGCRDIHSPQLKSCYSWSATFTLPSTWPQTFSGSSVVPMWP